jgi:hypothetical protein
LHQNLQQSFMIHLNGLRYLKILGQGMQFDELLGCTQKKFCWIV